MLRKCYPNIRPFMRQNIAFILLTECVVAVTFSGGQRRRLSLAMIFACAAPIVILDEPFVGIDKRTQERLWVNIKEELRNKTVIIIEHNFSDTQYFQKVFVITGYGKVERTK